jgi:hypothetical protein
VASGWSTNAIRMRLGTVARGGGAIVVLLQACASQSGGRHGSRQPGVEPRDTRIVHEECSVGDGEAVKEDINGDGKPDRVTVNEGSAACRGLDFNFDGIMDAWVYLDSVGQVRRRESDYDRDGRVDEVALYKAGVLTERQRATTLIGKLDTWEYYSSGKVARTERDSNGDSFVDQWWEYSAERATDCPLIHSDVDGDGRPDPGATVDVCRDQHVPESRDGEEPAAGPLDGDGVGSVPTEVEEEKATGSEAEKPAGASPPKDMGEP